MQIYQTNLLEGGRLQSARRHPIIIGYEPIGIRDDNRESCPPANPTFRKV